MWRSKSSPLGSSPIPVSRGDRRRGARGGTPRLRGRNHQLGCCVIIDTMSWEWLDVRPAMAGASAGRGWWHGVLLAGLLLALAGCEASPIGSAPATMPRGDGAVVGGIYPCSGPRLAKNPGCVAGIVTVLRGTAASAPASGGGVTRVVLPTDKVASRTLVRHQGYWFALPPGPYVVLARYAGLAGSGGIEPWVQVVVRVGKVTKQSIIARNCI